MVMEKEMYVHHTTILWEVDVLVIGGGSAGSTAAIAAAQQGSSVAIIDRSGYLGGISTSVLDTFYGFYCPGDAKRKVIGGIPDLVVAQLEEHKAAIARPNTYGAGTGITYDPEILKVVWESLALQAGVKILFHTVFVDVLKNGHGQVNGAIVMNKTGMHRILAGVVIDASGDGDVAYKAGAEYEDWHSGAVQSLTTTFRIGYVDQEKATQVRKDMLWALMKEAFASGDYALPRLEGSVHITPHRGIMATNMVRMRVEDPTDPIALSAAEIEGRKQALEYHRFLKDRVPGYEDSVLLNFSTYVGVRESRRIRGDYWLTRDDVVQARKQEDAIAMCGAPIEEHHSGTDTRWEYLPEGATYDIPYRSLLPEGVEGVVLAGRCLSASHDAHASVRSMGQCMAMGQAAGIAAAQAVARGTTPREVNVSALQAELIKTGAILDRRIS